MTVVTATQSFIDTAAAALRSGNLVVFPTETVYGLGALATDDMAVARLYQVKQRPKVNPLISHFADTDSALAAGKITKIALRLAEEFWPGPLTLIIDRHSKSPTCLLATAGMDNLAIRVPDHKVALALIKSTGGPVVAPSANMSGKLSPSCVSHISEQLAASCAVILDGGPCRNGLESTVIDCRSNGAIILRPGPITPDLIYARTGHKIDFFEGAPTVSQPLLSPGMMTSHYAPEAPVRLNAASVRDGEVFIGFGTPPEGIVPDLSLSQTGDLTEACARLFSVLHEADSHARLIAIAPIPMADLGIAINDRLMRAAAERP